MSHLSVLPVYSAVAEDSYGEGPIKTVALKLIRSQRKTTSCMEDTGMLAGRGGKPWWHLGNSFMVSEMASFSPPKAIRLRVDTDLGHLHPPASFSPSSLSLAYRRPVSFLPQ